MKGVILNVVEEVVVDQYGASAWEQILSNAGLDGIYTSLGNYPDSDFHAVVSAAAELLGVTVDGVLEAVGFHAFNHLYDRLPQKSRGFSDPIELLSDLDGVIHPQVKVLYPDAKPPEFSLTDGTDGTDGIIVTYRSGRNLSALAVGLIRGCFAHFNEAVSVETIETVDGFTMFRLVRNAST